MKTIFKISLISIAILFAACTTSQSIKTSNYQPADKTLYNTIVQQDSLLFAAFNNKDIAKLKLIFSDSLTVYQDNVGVRNFAQTINAFQDLFTKNYTLIRTPVKSSFEIYPIKDFGAIHTGQHTFCHTENGKEECATFKFVHIWQQQNDRWQLVKIITYDHKL